MLSLLPQGRCDSQLLGQLHGQLSIHQRDARGGVRSTALCAHIRYGDTCDCLSNPAVLKQNGVKHTRSRTKERKKEQTDAEHTVRIDTGSADKEANESIMIIMN